MTLIAHLTDSHLLEDNYRERSARARARLQFLSFGRPLDPAGRRKRLAAALCAAHRAGADHVVLTGDLTEDGVLAQFEVLADVLGASPFAPSAVTLVPGNHDGYGSADAWQRAIEGPLGAYRRTSDPEAIVALGDASLVPVATPLLQFFARSAARVTEEDIARIRRLRAAARNDRGPFIVALHHPPQPHRFAPWHWIDGMQGYLRMIELLLEDPAISVLHGHSHRGASVPVGEQAQPRVFSAEAVVESVAPLRLYAVVDRHIVPVAHRDSPAVLSAPPASVRDVPSYAGSAVAV